MTEVNRILPLLCAPFPTRKEREKNNNGYPSAKSVGSPSFELPLQSSEDESKTSKTARVKPDIDKSKSLEGCSPGRI